MSRLNSGLRAGGVNDDFFTPSALARKLISFVPLEEGSTLLDPFSGPTKPFYHNFPRGNFRKAQYEIKEGVNAYQQKERFDWIITNPPFSNIGKTLEWTMTIARVGFAYVMPLHSLSHNRVAWLESCGWFINGFYTFENPAPWKINFPHAFVIWTRNSSSNIGTSNEKMLSQSQLFCEECQILLFNTTDRFCSECSAGGN